MTEQMSAWPVETGAEANTSSAPETLTPPDTAEGREIAARHEQAQEDIRGEAQAQLTELRTELQDTPDQLGSISWISEKAYTAGDMMYKYAQIENNGQALDIVVDTDTLQPIMIGDKMVQDVAARAMEIDGQHYIRCMFDGDEAIVVDTQTLEPLTFDDKQVNCLYSVPVQIDGQEYITVKFAGENTETVIDVNTFAPLHINNVPATRILGGDTPEQKAAGRSFINVDLAGDETVVVDTQTLEPLHINDSPVTFFFGDRADLQNGESLTINTQTLQPIKSEDK